MSDHLNALHFNGVHTQCRPAERGHRGDGTHRKCPLAGRIERVHGHDYDGPLVCGCLEVAG